MNERNEIVEEARAGMLQCQAQIDVYETTLHQQIDRLREISGEFADDPGGCRGLDDDDLHLLLVAAQVAVMRHLQAKFERVLIEHGGDRP